MKFKIFLFFALATIATSLNLTAQVECAARNAYSSYNVHCLVVNTRALWSSPLVLDAQTLS